MSTWKDLPAEILDLIFSIITDEEAKLEFKYSIRECQLTCKNWNQHAQRKAYRSIYIQQPHQFKQLVATLNSSESNPGQYLKELTVIEADWGRIIPKEELFEQFLTKCPNIEKITAPNPLKVAEGQIFGIIQKAYERGLCNRLKVIPVLHRFSGAGPTIQYYSARYCLRNNLEKLVLHQELDNESISPVDSLQQRLKDYPKVRHLTVRRDSWTLPEILYGTLTDIRSVTPFPNVERLDLHINLSAKLLEYIMHVFPNLDYIHMEARNLIDVDDEDDNVYASISDELWVQFLSHMHHRIKNGGCLKDLPINGMPRVLADFFNTTKCYKDICIIYEHFQNSVDISFQTNSTTSTVQVTFKQTSDEVEPPYKQLLRGIGGFLKSLTFIGIDGDPPFLDIGLVLDTICQQCPSLAFLTFSKVEFVVCNPGTYTYTSVKSLTMKDSLLSPDVFPELSTRLPALVYLAVINYHYYDEHFQGDRPNCVIEMPSTSFDILNWDMSDAGNYYYSDVNLAVETSAKIYYYYCAENSSVTKSSSISFQKKSWDDFDAFSLYIQCQSIKSLQLRFRGGLWEIDFSVLKS
jgi:hypothetical protein